MLEAKEGCAFLEDVDEQTFVRFSEYAYVGDYTTAEPEIFLDSSMTENTEVGVNGATAASDEDGLPLRKNYDFGSVIELVEPSIAYADPIEDEWGFEASKKKSKKKAAFVDNSTEPPVPQSKKSILWDSFKSKLYTTSHPSFQPRKNRKACEIYTPVFLSHARLYVFAEKYDIRPLKNLSLHKLQRTLSEFNLYLERVGDVVELLQYIYENTGEHENGKVDDLRSLVAHYTACVVEKLAENDEFQGLLERAGSFVRDLIKRITERLD